MHTYSRRKRVSTSLRFVTKADRAFLARTMDTDVGRSLMERIADLEQLLAAYRSGTIKQRAR